MSTDVGQGMLVTMKLHVVDGTYELFRTFFGSPPATAPDGLQVGATRGLLRTLLALVTSDGATHVGVAYDHVIESFRNSLYAGYKTGAGIDPALERQFPLAEEATRALGLTAWPMVQFEADDALAAAAARFADEVDQVVICTPDKDMMQCVRSERVVCWDRRRRKVYDAAGVLEKYGVPPVSIADWLALVGDAADGFPGIPRWGAKSSATVLRHYVHLDRIPDDPTQWEVPVRGAAGLARHLAENRADADLFRTLATLRTDAPLHGTTDLASLEWRGADRARLQALCERIGDNDFPKRIRRWRDDA